MRNASEVSINVVANGYVVFPGDRCNGCIVDSFVFETFDALVAYLAKIMKKPEN